MLVAFDLNPGLPRILAFGLAVTAQTESGHSAAGSWWAFESYLRVKSVLRGMSALGRPWSEILILRVDQDPGARVCHQADGAVGDT